MNASEWKRLGLFAAGCLALSVWSTEAAWILAGALAFVTVVTHGPALVKQFGGGS